MLELKEVSKFYSSNGITNIGLHNINLKLNRNEIIAITGESGSGKSTLLNVISKNVVAAIDYVYNEKGMLSKKTISANGSEVVYYTEYPENSSPVTKIKVNGGTVESHSKTDSFGRKVFDIIDGEWDGYITF